MDLKNRDSNAITEKLLFSVIIPTLNRCDYLSDSLLSVINQNFCSDDYEIIVVDNGSSDRTNQIVSEISKKCAVTLKYIYEHRPGLHWARHAGARAAKGHILAYTDDDAVAHPDWLRKLLNAYTDLDADCAGGKILIQWDQEPESWVIPFEKVLGYIDYGPEMCLIKTKKYFAGGNLSIKRERLFEIGGFNPDQIGEFLVGNGEVGLCWKIYKAGWRMVWAPGALVWHRQFVKKNGTLKDLKRRYANNGCCEAYADFKQMRYRKFGLLKRIVESTAKAMNSEYHSLKRRLTKDHKFYQFELSSSYNWAVSRYFLRIFLDSKFRQIPLREDWINE